jgi:hypothetical protein
MDDTDTTDGLKFPPIPGYVPTTEPAPLAEDCLFHDFLEIRVGTGLIPLFDSAEGGDGMDRIHQLRLDFAKEMGFLLPTVFVRSTPDIDPMSYEFRIDGQLLATGSLSTDRLLAMHGNKVTKKIRGLAAAESAFGAYATWILPTNMVLAQKYGYTVVEPTSAFLAHFSDFIRKHIDVLLNTETIQELLNNFKKKRPHTVSEAESSVGNIHIRHVLQLLLRERIPIKHLGTILEALIDWSKNSGGLWGWRYDSKDPLVPTAYVRTKLAIAICNMYRDKNKVLNVVMLDPALEAQILAGYEEGDKGPVIRMPSQEQVEISTSIETAVGKLLGRNHPPVVLVTHEVRAVLKYITIETMPDLVVLSQNEISKDTKVVSFGFVAPCIRNLHVVDVAPTIPTVTDETICKNEKPIKHAFSTSLLNCDTDLEELTHKLENCKYEDFSLCLYGVPGSGKSEYARFLANKLNMKVLQKRGSDLFSAWVGQAEKNIAEAFSEAVKKRMFLVFDEADSFLLDRRHAIRTWEVTQVNEMLTHMESHPLPFVCTTNLMEAIDQASLRRFTFKVKYDFLTPSQVELAFRHFFGTDSTVSLDDLTYMSPGDFAVVVKKARIFGIDDHAELVTLLKQEQDVKEVAKATPKYKFF